MHATQIDIAVHGINVYRRAQFDLLQLRLCDGQQRKNAQRFKNMVWFDGVGNRLARGDLILNDILNIATFVEEGMFVALYERDAVVCDGTITSVAEHAALVITAQESYLRTVSPSANYAEKIEGWLFQQRTPDEMKELVLQGAIQSIQ